MSARLGQITLIITIIAVGYFVFSYVQGSVKVGKTITTTTTLETDLVGHWTFDGKHMSTSTATDISGSGNDGTLSGGPVTSIGKIGQAMEFDGSDDYIDTVNYDFIAGGWTLSSWFKIEPNVTGPNRIFSKLSSVVNQKWLMLVNGVVDFGADDGTDVNYVSTGSTKYNDGQWHHAVVVVDNTNVILYVDGVQADSTGHGDSFYNNSSKWRLGARNDGVEYFTGALDDPRIYSRALSVDEVQQLYNQGAGSKVGKTLTPSGLETGLVGHWTFDGPDMTTSTSSDVSGNGNDGTLQSDPVPTAGVVGQGLEFDGTSDSVSMGDNATFDFGTGAFTAAAWIKSSINGTEPKAIFSKRNTCGYGNFWNLTLNSSGRLALEVDETNAGDYLHVQSTQQIDDGEWHHVVGVRSGNVVTIYIDGVYENDTAGATPDINNTHSFNIGEGPCEDFDGIIDDARVYSRALSADEVTQLYNLGGNKVAKTFTPTGLTSGLVGHWTFDGPDMTTATATDISGSGNDGALTGGPVNRIGKIGQALEFDGSNDYVNVGTPTELNDLGPYTLSAWVYKTSNPANDDYVLGKRDGACTGAWKWNLTSTGEIDWFKKGTSNVVRNSTAGSIPNDGWFHLLTTWDGGTNFSGVHHYVNGVETSYSTESNGSALNSDATCNLNIGTSDSGFGLFDGSLDDVRIYDRVLSADEITQLYNLGR